MPEPIKNIVRLIRRSMIEPLQKKILVKKMHIKHQRLLADIKDKEKIKVVFLELFEGMWKLDPVFRKMLDDPRFEPIILICPCISYSEDVMWEGMERTYTFFKNKNYPVISAYVKAEERWINLQEIKPDIVFFSIPHNMTKKEYYYDAYLNYLSCYIPYSHQVSNYHNFLPQYDLFFHNAQWKIFAPHICSYNISRTISHTKGRNVYVTGYPMMEAVFNKKLLHDNNIWKNKDNRKRVIWAPHHTVDVDYLPYSNFLEYAEDFLKLVEKYKDKVVWSFKPHPELKAKLYKHKDWGKKRTDEYYTYWSNQEFTQLNLDEYLELFLFSDAIIHDSGSFLAEYLYMKKPALYLLSKNNNLNFYNEFGSKALNSYRTAKKFSEIETFIHELVFRKNIGITEDHEIFFNKEILPYFVESLPSDKIISLIKGDL